MHKLSITGAGKASVDLESNNSKNEETCWLKRDLYTGRKTSKRRLSKSKPHGVKNYRKQSCIFLYMEFLLPYTQ